MSTPARAVEAEVCDSEACRTAPMMVRADQVQFVTPAQVRKVGYHKLDTAKMPSDLSIPAPYVLVHDTAGLLLSRCDLYVVKWHRMYARSNPSYAVPVRVEGDLKDYFGPRANLQWGEVEIPNGPWKRFAMVQFIRYRRAGKEAGLYEHEYEIPVTLYGCKNPLAWRISLPSGCKVDERGFVWP
jgi:hypothetical protein